MSEIAQPLRALEIANAAKRRRFEIRRALRHRNMTLAEAFEDESIARVQIREVMEWVPHLTPQRVSYVLLWARVGYAREVGSIRASEYRRIMQIIAQRHPTIRVAP